MLGGGGSSVNFNFSRLDWKSRLAMGGAPIDA
jgi:hypothetical protein